MRQKCILNQRGSTRSFAGRSRFTCILGDNPGQLSVYRGFRSKGDRVHIITFRVTTTAVSDEQYSLSDF